MKCKNCGREIIKGEHYCRSCGADAVNARMCINRDPELHKLLSETRAAPVTKNRKGNKNKTIIIICAAFAVIAAVAVFAVTGNGPKSYNNYTATNTEFPQITEESLPVIAQVTEAAVEPTLIPTPEPTPEPVQRRGTAEPIPPEIRDQMYGLSYKQNNNISLDDLSYLTIPHYDFNYEVQTGHLVVNSTLAEEVLDIFAELYDIKYPIERMELIDKYDASDFQSIEYNNTSSFNYRESTSGSGKLSMHALGRAIDINPQINPYVNSSGTGAHENAREYWSRDKNKWSSEVARAAYIGTDAEIYRIFTSRGWTWGGSWSSYRDYQHFEK